MYEILTFSIILYLSLIKFIIINNLNSLTEYMEHKAIKTGPWSKFSRLKWT